MKMKKQTLDDYAEIALNRKNSRQMKEDAILSKIKEQERIIEEKTKYLVDEINLDNIETFIDNRATAKDDISKAELVIAACKKMLSSEMHGMDESKNPEFMEAYNDVMRIFSKESEQNLAELKSLVKQVYEKAETLYKESIKANDIISDLRLGAGCKYSDHRASGNFWKVKKVETDGYKYIVDDLEETLSDLDRISA